jgi:hypothetical protein
MVIRVLEGPGPDEPRLTRPDRLPVVRRPGGGGDDRPHFTPGQDWVEPVELTRRAPPEVLALEATQ